MPIDNIGLDYKSNIKYNPNKNMLKLQLENLTYEELFYLHHPSKLNNDNTFDKLIHDYLFNHDISINMIQIEQINNKDIESIFLIENNIPKA